MAANSKSRKKLFIFGGLGLLAIILILVVVFGSKRENVITIQTEKAARRTLTQIVTASGKIQPETQVKINAEVSGEIILLPVKEGQRVRRGELLVRIKPDQYQAQVDRAQAGLSSSKASLTLQAASLEKAQSEFKRAEELFQKKLMSEQEYVSAKTALQVAKSQYESANAGVAQANASLRDSKESLAKTSIYSPMDGVVSQLISELGERVSGSSFMQGTEIMTVADLSMMEARVDIGENDVVLIKLGDTARVQVDAYANRKFKGNVTEIANTATTKGAGSQDEVTNFQVKIRILDKDVVFRPGMSMSADVETETKKNVLSVPIQSVTTRVLKPKEGEKPKQGDGVANAAAKGTETPHADKPKEVIFVIDNGKVKAIPVKRGISDDLNVEILEGVTDQQEVVSGSFKAINRDLEDGALVKIDNAQKRFGMAKKEN